MAIESGFYTGQAITAELLNTAFAGVISNGVRTAYTADELQVVANTNMLINIKRGYAVIEGSMLHNTDNYTLTVDTADGVLDRIDRVVARQDKSTSPVTNKILIVKGALSDTPVAPALVRDGTYYDLSLATISVAHGTTEITDSLITDTRFDSDVCGAFFCLAKKIDTTALFAQFQTRFNQLITDMGQDDHVTVVVDSDAVSIDGKPILLDNPTQGQTLVFDENGNIINGEGLTEKDVFAFCPDGTTEIPDQPSYDTTWGMPKLYIPDSVITIGSYFMYKGGIQEVIGGENIVSFGNYAFQQCDNLISLNLPEATTFSNQCCYMCTNLESVSFPKVTNLANSAFASCPKLTNIDFGGRSNCITIVYQLYLQSVYLTDESFLEVANALRAATPGENPIIHVKAGRWASVPETTKNYITISKGYTISES